MTTPTAILIGAALLAAAICFGLTSGYRYQMTTGFNGMAVFKIDKFTGEIWLCGYNDGGPKCRPYSN